MVRRLWDSWEDDAEIRDAATGRFVDRDKLHYIDFEGRCFRVTGPVDHARGRRRASRWSPRSRTRRSRTGWSPASADVGFVTPHDAAQAAAIVAEIRAAQDAGGPRGETVHVFADLVVFLDDDRRGRRRPPGPPRRAAPGAPYSSDAAIFAGTAGRAGRPARRTGSRPG